MRAEKEAAGIVEEPNLADIEVDFGCEDFGDMDFEYDQDDYGEDIEDYDINDDD